MIFLPHDKTSKKASNKTETLCEMLPEIWERLPRPLPPEYAEDIEFTEDEGFEATIYLKKDSAYKDSIAHITIERDRSLHLLSVAAVRDIEKRIADRQVLYATINIIPERSDEDCFDRQKYLKIRDDKETELRKMRMEERQYENINESPGEGVDPFED